MTYYHPSFQKSCWLLMSLLVFLTFDPLLAKDANSSVPDQAPVSAPSQVQQKQTVQPTTEKAPQTGDTAKAEAPKTEEKPPPTNLGDRFQGLKSKLSESPLEIDFVTVIAKIFWTLVLLGLAYFFIRYFSLFMEALAERWTSQRLLLKGLTPVFRIVFWTLSLTFTIKWVFNPSYESILTFTASAGIALGFASQDILKNIFGGIMILLDRPFQVGDKIEVDKYYGEVVHIGLRTVRIVTPDDSLVSIPNSAIVNQTISNSNSGESNCQVVTEIFLPVETDWDKVKAIAKQAAVCSRYVFLGKPISVVLKNELQEGRSVMKLRLKAYVLDHRFEFAFSTEVTEILMKELLRQKILTAQWCDYAKS